MHWQNIIVYAILIVCLLFLAVKLQKIFSKKLVDHNNPCENCQQECEHKTYEKKSSETRLTK